MLARRWSDIGAISSSQYVVLDWLELRIAVNVGLFKLFMEAGFQSRVRALEFF